MQLFLYLVFCFVFFIFVVSDHIFYLSDQNGDLAGHMSCQNEKIFAALQNDHNINNNNNNIAAIIMTLLSPRFATYSTSSTTRADTAVEPSFHTGDLQKIIIKQLHKNLEIISNNFRKKKLYNPFVRNLTKNINY